MQSPPIISVIIPVYNAEPYLRQCLDSVTGQTLRDIEIICVDDGSSDRSPAILNEYAQADPRIIVMTQENKSAGAARNRGMAAARGRYLSFLDADDFFEADMLEKAYRSAEENRSDIVVFLSDNYIDTLGVYRFIPFTVREDLLPKQRPFAGTDLQKNAFRALMGWAWDKLFSADFVRSHGLRFQEQRTTNDMLFVFSAIVAARRISIVDQVLAHQRKGGSGSLSVTREKSWDCFYQALLALRQQLKDWDLYERFERDFINYSLHFSLWHLETLAWPTQEKLYRQLKQSWYAELGVIGKSRFYFYSDSDYIALRRILKLDYAQVYPRLDTRRRPVDENGSPIPSRVSVIVPSFRDAAHLRQCLASLTSQSEPLLEILCVWGSSDGDVLDVLMDFEQRDYRLRILPAAGADLLGCLQTGLREARGAYCAIIEAQDLSAENMVSTLYGLAAAHGPDAVLSDYVEFSDEGGRCFEYKSCLAETRFYGQVLRPSAEAALPAAEICPQAALYRSDFLRRALAAPDLTEDPAFYPQFVAWILTHAESLLSVKEALYFRRVDPRQADPLPGFFADLVGWLRRARIHGRAYARAYAAHRRSPVYCLEQAITWLPRKTGGLIRCIRDHGLRYTLALAVAKLRR